VIEKRWQRWREHDPINLSQNIATALKSLRGIYIDCGWRDQFHIHYGARNPGEAPLPRRHQAHVRGIRRRSLGTSTTGWM